MTIYRNYFDSGTSIGAIEVFKGKIDNIQLNYDPSGGCAVGIEVTWSTGQNKWQIYKQKQPISLHLTQV